MIHARRAALTGAAAALALTVSGPTVLAAQAATAPAPSALAPASPSTTDGLLDPIGGLLGGILATLGSVLNGLLGSSQITSLEGVTGTLQGGAAPSASTLAPLTAWLTTVSTTGGVPVELQSTAGQVAGLLASPTTPDAPLSVLSLAGVTSLLTQLQGTSGLSLNGVTALSGLVSALTAAASALTSGTGGEPAPLPIVGALPIGGGLLAPLQGLIDTLTGGTTATGPLLSPVAALLRQVAALPGVDSLLGSTLTQLADQVDAVSGELGTDLLGTLTSTLQSLGSTSGVPTEVSGLLGTLTGLLTGSSTGTPIPVPGGTTPPSTTPPAGTSPPAAKPGTGTASAVGSVRIASLRVDRRLGRVRVALACPARGPACRTLLAAYRGRVLEASSPVIAIPAGATVKRALRLDAATRRLLKRKTLRFRVSAVLPSGRLSTRTVTAKLPKAKKASKRTKPAARKVAGRRTARG